MIQRIIRSVANRSRTASKSIRWRFASNRKDYGQIVFVLGCQRSGTTLLMNCFDQDRRARVFRDDSALTGFRGNRLRLKPYREVERILAKCRSPLVVAKPLLDSQLAGEILSEYPRSKAIWMFRNYRGVIGSSLKKFSSQVESIRRVVDQPDDWRGERVHHRTIEFIKPFVSSNMRREDAAALIWIARNQLFFNQSFDSSKLVSVLNYEDLVNSSDDALRGIYGFLELDFPVYSITHSIHQNSLVRGQGIEIDATIEKACRALQRRLHQCVAFNTQSQSLSEDNS